ncbi:NADP-dependent phosphogluconate dehydrogenase [Facklamia miroungae]|uniref:6-phosphogluconate dehydrogenase, decarboxylating n=1 Tax=Facklamia miroungae TaxID=120956 RepID=A0A1G7VAG0_9LACT|nr:NADP-dependent phosphogluconate dehydrogenase [Facklamia miroungae]NKZ30277.1 NADP-dependent phosphogluconate dehydrogenase [Facklamia miroungae]SDG56329.1 6-phosphogluconate dehydrogenase [Facklamia miroungae]
MTLAQVGVVGMAVMGKNLALNIESKGYRVAIYNRSKSKTEAIIASHSAKNLLASYDLESFVQSIERPRRILLMVKAGQATDSTIQSLLPLLDQGDILIDGGNTFFKDTMRRAEALANSGIHFIGMGVSGGEEGALYGPALMPGGPKEAYDLVEPILKEIAAKAPADQEPCVAYMGENGAGHYVKMVHNGIEYGDMQLIAESYAIMSKLLKMSADEIAQVFEEWNQGELNSYLIEITANILKQKDPLSGRPMVEMIVDKAGNKGTGKWTSQSALDLGVPLPTITESVYARFISALKDERIKAAQIIQGPNHDASIFQKDRQIWIEKIRQALYFSKIMSYAQGFAQYRSASQEFQWDLNYSQISRVFRAGCIIRARFLQDISDAFDRNKNLTNLLLDEFFTHITNQYQTSVREIIALSVQAGVPVPGFSSAIAYYDSYRSEVLPANLIQAQRDYFGAHTYERVDKEGVYHFIWNDACEERIDL